MNPQPERKLYVITRRDLPPAVRVVMALHVTANIVHSDLCTVSGEEWTEHGPPIVFMAVRSRIQLENLRDRYQILHTYSDPDLNDGLCALALYAETWDDDRARIALFGEHVSGQ